MDEPTACPQCGAQPTPAHAATQLADNLTEEAER